MEKKIIYLDHAATTATRPEVVDAMLPYFTENFWNPSSVYTPALNNRKVVDESRETIARSLGTTPENIYFTAGGSESDNWALKCTAEAYANKGKHIITSKIEHHAILHTCEYLEKKGFEITYIDVDENGILKLDDLKAAIRPDTILISVMFANNEIGTVQPIKELCDVAHENGSLFHTDAVQAVGHISINVHNLGVDMLSASAHKFNGPKGVGFLYIRNGIEILPYSDGGAQESGLRAGTENIAGIVGMAVALKNNCDALEENVKHVRGLESKLVDMLDNTGIQYTRNGGADRLPGLVSLSFPGIEGEAILHRLDLNGICVSTGSACNSKSTEVSHVLQAIRLEDSYAKGTIRISLGKANTEDEVEAIFNALVKIFRI